ncbi:predicted protein, partial [Nematostella vectensis]
PELQGMLELDRDLFQKVIKLPAIRIDAKDCNIFRKKLQNVLLNRPRLKNIVPDPDVNCRTKKIIVLRPGATLSDDEKAFVKSRGGLSVNHEMTLGYSYWTSEQILREVLPPEITDVPSGFETIGHIAHVNLRDNQLKFKNIIGQVIMDKNSPQIKTVVNKTNTIDDTFRFFKMEVIAGENNLQTSIIQNGITYEFDFSKVYWNSRLQAEHDRLVDSFSSSDVICDMFAGVGPFAIPAAKKGCFVYANDLNPSSFKALEHNAKTNQVADRIKAFNLDGREFVMQVTENTLKENNKMFNHVVMNLPATALQFLDVFKGLFSGYEDKFISSLSGSTLINLPSVHCYCFSKDENPMMDAQKQAEKVLGASLEGICKVYHVRNVAPKKQMMCVSFKLPSSVAF